MICSVLINFVYYLQVCVVVVAVAVYCSYRYATGVFDFCAFVYLVATKMLFRISYVYVVCELLMVFEEDVKNEKRK